MAFSTSTKVFLRYNSIGNSCLDICPCTVRRNASPKQRPLLSDTSSITFLGLSKQEALQYKKTLAASAVSALLREYGFTDAHISRLENRFPCIFQLSPQKNLSVKFKFLESIGLSSTEIPKFVLRNPYLLSASLEKKMIPCYNYLKNLPISEEQLNRMLKSGRCTLTVNLEATIAPNVELLRGMGVPSSIITYCVAHHHLAIRCNHALFKSSVDQAIEIGLNPSTKTFIVAVRILCAISEESWARKMEVYRGFGLSDDEILLAFRKQPWIMFVSEKKIARGLEFFLKELSWSRATLTSNPVVLQLNLERRVVPRCQVMEILRKKGLMNIATVNFLLITEERFLNSYIRNKDDSSELMDIYKRYSSTSQEI